jgi:hypothetical protein
MSWQNRIVHQQALRLLTAQMRPIRLNGRNPGELAGLQQCLPPIASSGQNASRACANSLALDR